MLRRAASQINCEATSRESIGKIKRARFFVHAGIPLKSPPLRTSSILATSAGRS
jgi:hypothetical protein